MAWCCWNQFANRYGARPFQARVRSMGIVGDPPYFDEPAGRGLAQEEMLAEALVPEAPDEALNRHVLFRLARLGVMLFDLGVASPLEDGMTGAFHAVV